MRVGGRSNLSRAKIKSVSELARIVSRLKASGKCVVFTNGCFDILHYGHTRYLEEARSCGDALVVAVNSDASVRRIKGPKRPVVGEKDRAGVIASLASVDYVTIFGQDTPLEVIRRIKPDVLVKGADWKTKDIAGADLVLASGGKVVRIRLQKGRSTTALLKKISRK